MKISEEYRRANGFTPEMIADTMMAFYDAVDARCEEILANLKASGITLKCRAGCCGCCSDGLSMTQAEASVIRKLFPDIGKELPHAEGACPFLDASGLCRIYRARPYICRTHGLPMRSLISAEEASEMGIACDGSGQEAYEARDICEENESLADIMELPDESCWTVGVAEAKIAAMDLCTYGESKRIPMRNFFQN